MYLRGLVVGLGFVFDFLPLLKRPTRNRRIYFLSRSFMCWLLKLLPILNIFNIGVLITPLQVRLACAVALFNFNFFHLLKLVDDLAGRLLALPVELD